MDGIWLRGPTLIGRQELSCDRDASPCTMTSSPNSNRSSVQGARPERDPPERELGNTRVPAHEVANLSRGLLQLLLPAIRLGLGERERTMSSRTMASL
jgi:hypothetical protein